MYFNVQRKCNPRDPVGSVTACALVNTIILYLMMALEGRNM